MMHVANSAEPDQRIDWMLALLVIGATTVVLVVLGWIGPDIDVWYGVGLVRAIVERPLAPESLGHVPKVAHLALLAPGATLGATPERWLLIVGMASLVVLLWCHARWAQAVNVAVPRLILALAIAPLLWRATLDGGSVAWGWSCVLLALTAHANGRRGAPAWLALAALFRPECVGAGLALGMLGQRSGDRGAWRLAVAPLAAGALGTGTVDLIWSGAIGASSIAHGIFESVGLEQVRGRWGFADTGHPWFHLSLPLLILAAIAVLRRTAHVDVSAREKKGGLAGLATAAVGFSIVTVINVVMGGTLFVRFLLPWISVMAALGAGIPWAVVRWRQAVALGAATMLAGLGWQRVAPEFVGTYPTAAALLVARRVARATAPELVVAMDAGARAVALGSGARPWKTTPWILQSAEIPCVSQVIIARDALLARMDRMQLERCGPWQDFVVDSAQRRVNLRVLLARRAGSPLR
jgi:hypothetical protein